MFKLWSWLKTSIFAFATTYTTTTLQFLHIPVSCYRSLFRTLFGLSHWPIRLNSENRVRRRFRSDAIQPANLVLGQHVTVKYFDLAAGLAWRIPDFVTLELNLAASPKVTRKYTISGFHYTYFEVSHWSQLYHLDAARRTHSSGGSFAWWTSRLKGDVPDFIPPTFESLPAILVHNPEQHIYYVASVLLSKLILHLFHDLFSSLKHDFGSLVDWRNLDSLEIIHPASMSPLLTTTSCHVGFPIWAE